MWYRIKEAIEDGILITVKYGMITLIIFYVVMQIMQVYQMSVNGQQAAIAIREFQDKGYLPKFPISNKSGESK